MSKTTIIRFLILLFAFNCFLSGLTYKPDTYNSFDYPFSDDTLAANSNEVNKYNMYSYQMGTTDYVDKRNSIYYKAKQLCYEGSDKTTLATYNTGVVAANPSLDLSPTLIPTLYDQTCIAVNGSGLFFPLFFHADSTTIVYHLIFKLVNTNASDASFKIVLEEFVSTGTPNLINLNSSAQTVLANSIINYEIRFTCTTAGVVTYKLQEDNFAISTSTTAAKVYYKNTNYASLPAYPTTAPSMKIYLDDTYGGAGLNISVAAIILQTGLNILLI
jgi:hypothetical protein